MEYIIGFIALFIGAIIVGSIRASKTAKDNLIAKLKRNWGHIVDQEYTAERFNSLGFYYRAKEATKLDIDDITVNDTDLDEIFMYINNTCSAMGEEYLYSLLRKPVKEQEILDAREKVIEYFGSHSEERLKLQLLLSKIGKLKAISLYEYLNSLKNVPEEKNFQHLILLLLYPLSIGMIFLNPSFGVFLLIATVSYAIVTYFKSKASKETYYTILLILLGTIKLSDKLDEFETEELAPYIKQIKDAAKILKPMNKFSFILTSRGQNIADILLDYVRMTTHLDMVKFNNIIKLYRENSEALNIIFDGYGFLDSMLAIASFREWLPEYSVPEFVTDKGNFIEVENLYHPLITNPVKNSISAGKCVLLTGSNASGKSTFIKSLAINAILSQTINTSLSSAYKAPFFKVISSMALRDNLTNGESYYIVEIKSLKRILDAAEDDTPVLCFVDEVLRGTNTLERIAASSQILNTLSKSNCICFAATHDLELADILAAGFDSYHFSEKLTEKDVEFDYILKTGKATSRNAIRLLSKMGYPEGVTEAADAAAAEFEATNNWSSIK